ncbi:MAG: hypothetical protein J6R54_10080, partial [Bacteroidaceae bacterium]|nr:hypothetical protein [Bacteroidaceae bacterium]
MLLFYSYLIVIQFSFAVGMLLCGGADAEQGRVGLDMDGLSVWIEFNNAHPSVAAVSFPSSAQNMYV